MDRISKHEVHNLFNRLVCVVKALEGQYTTIDLRGDSCVTGKIINVDGYMNIYMEDCVFYNPRGETYPFDNFFVTERKVLYVHIPEGLSAIELAHKQLSQLRVPRNQGRPILKGGALFRKNRMERYQKEILEEIASTSTV